MPIPTQTKFDTMPSPLVFVTGNANKLKEVKAILGESVDMVNNALDLPELQGTIEEVTLDKARRAAEAVHPPHRPPFLPSVTARL